MMMMMMSTATTFDDVVLRCTSETYTLRGYPVLHLLFYSSKECTRVCAVERDYVATTANVAAALYQVLNEHLEDTINWCGFYFLRPSGRADAVEAGEELVLGPFQGKPACPRILVGKGVCGTAVQQRKSILVEDVHSFPGHIACDAGEWEGCMGCVELCVP